MRNSTLACFVGLAALTGCESRPAADHALAGEWTPVGINDCSRSGSVVEIRRDHIHYQAGNSGAPIAQVLSASEPEPGVVHLTIRPRNKAADGREELGREEVLRFEVAGDSARVTGESFDGGLTFAPIQVPGITEIFTLKRCDGGL